jgi:carboxymethylenebutenolidase
MTEATSIPGADGEVPAMRSEPPGPAKGGVVVVQEAFGLTDHIGSICDRLAEAGWLAIAPALFHRQGAPTFQYGDFESIMPVMKELTADGIRSDIDAAVDRVVEEGHPTERIGIVGFCMGGAIALDTAARRTLGAAVTFYGGGVVEGRFGLPSLVESAPHLQTPWLGLYGDLDHGIPPEQSEALRAAAARSSVTNELVRYGDADHGFNNDDRPDVFNAKAAEDGWRRTLAWLDLYAGADPASGPD